MWNAAEVPTLLCPICTLYGTPGRHVESDKIIGIHVGSIIEKLALFIDDLILFLNDPGPFLTEALNILSDYATFSGLRTNWVVLDYTHRPRGTESD